MKDGRKMLDIFIWANKVMDEINASLEELLQMRRTDFPRFYFLSNDELLTILAKS